MTTITELIRSHREPIVAAWLASARQSASARDLARPELVEVMEDFVAALGEGSTCEEDRGRAALDEHVASRMRQGFHLTEIVEELMLLGRCVLAELAGLPRPEQPGADEVEALLAELQRASVHATDAFTRHMLDEEQTDKRYLRLFEAAASRHRARTAPAADLMRELLELILDALGAQSATILLYDATRHELRAVASVGLANEVLEKYVASTGPSSLAGRIAGGRARALELLDVETTELEVSDSLRKSGIHSVLGARLPSRGDLIGVVYVGRADTRRFAPREILRLETLTERLVLLIAAARLNDELRATIAGLEGERAVREQFVSLLAHDLRGPLSAAKMAASILVSHPEALDARVDLATRIDRNIERTDRMVRDLLDANRIRAGERLALSLAPCDLREIAGHVVDELAASHGDRFELVSPDTVTGTWDADELRRAIWNLTTNAVKYGAPTTPITIRIARVEDDRVRVSVHNVGPAIPPESQPRLFEPFAQARTDGRRGWGLGLALVRGVAEAHGGRAWVESTAELGTTFTIEVPGAFAASARSSPDRGASP